MAKIITKRTHVVIPSKVVAAIDSQVGKRRRSWFIVQAAERELRRLEQMKAVRAAAGAWRLEDHPEHRRGVTAWVRKLRVEGERRLGRTTHKAP
jgi:Arc/MetJ-type ribon-helix-helix transcriptional regulator